MKRFLGSIVLTFVTGIAIVLAMPVSITGAQSQNNFKISNYDIQYELSKGENGRSNLKTTETITAVFPQTNQNHGLERAYPIKYDGHSTHLKIDSITKADGSKWQYSTSSRDGLLIVRAGNPDIYVHGKQTYKITYTQTDVTRFFADTDRDEWYWDTTGTEWGVPIEQLAISVKLSDDIASEQLGEASCYIGAVGSNERCPITKVSDSEYTVLANNLPRGESVTLAYGFKKGTFAQYQATLGEVLFGIWTIILLVTTVIAFILFIWFIVMYYRHKNRQNELHTVPVQYIPPKNTSVTIAAQVVAPTGSVFAAQLIDFAVRHYISIVETKPKSTWLPAEYDIQILMDPARLLEEEQEILSDMFGSLPKVGDRLALSKLHTDTKYYKRTSDNDKKIVKLVEGPYALRHVSKTTSWFYYKWAIILGVVGLLILSIPFVVLAGIVAIFGSVIRPLTDNGLEIRRHLQGLNTYIKAAEAERLKFLQGPDTAEKVGEKVDVENPGQIVKLYERVLPYAILFGHEKEWTKQLGEKYEQTNVSPSWYSGSSTFNAAVFAGAMSSFSSAASYSGGSSSSSGGSSGGGSVGGGGGGGGGGGW